MAIDWSRKPMCVYVPIVLAEYRNRRSQRLSRDAGAGRQPAATDSGDERMPVGTKVREQPVLILVA